MFRNLLACKPSCLFESDTTYFKIDPKSECACDVTWKHKMD